MTSELEDVSNSTEIIVHPWFVRKQKRFEEKLSKHSENIQKLDHTKYKVKYIWVKSAKKGTVAKIPNDVILTHILPYLDHTEVVRVSSVSKTWYILTKQEFIWKKLLYDEFHTNIEEFNVKVDPKVMFKSLYRTRRQVYFDAFVTQTAQSLSGTYNIPPHLAFNLAIATSSR